jgi:hypothetical protein
MAARFPCHSLNAARDTIRTLLRNQAHCDAGSQRAQSIRTRLTDQRVMKKNTLDSGRRRNSIDGCIRHGVFQNKTLRTLPISDNGAN